MYERFLNRARYQYVNKQEGEREKQRRTCVLRRAAATFDALVPPAAVPARENIVVIFT